VEFLGFGGGEGDNQQQDQQRKGGSKGDRQSYNANSRLQVVGIGALTDDQKQQLTDSEQHKLAGQ
jgi:hypothetical protein